MGGDLSPDGGEDPQHWAVGRRPVADLLDLFYNSLEVLLLRRPVTLGVGGFRKGEVGVGHW